MKNLKSFDEFVLENYNDTQVNEGLMLPSKVQEFKRYIAKNICKNIDGVLKFDSAYLIKLLDAIGQSSDNAKKVQSIFDKYFIAKPKDAKADIHWDNSELKPEWKSAIGNKLKSENIKEIEEGYGIIKDLINRKDKASSMLMGGGTGH